DQGTSAVDESMLTGESAPVDKTVNSELYAGTVNLNGRLVMHVTATGDETALAHIIAAVQRAQMSRAKIQRLGDQVSSVFVPVVICIALAAGLWWGLAPQSAMGLHRWVAQFIWVTHPPQESLAAAVIIAASVLIIACPCAMGLATPAAIMAGSNAAAQRGILIRDGVALEKAGSITAVLFDKTGTLTAGKPSVVSLWEPATRRSAIPTGPPSAESGSTGAAKEQVSISGLAAALARNSSHPISQAIANLAVAEVDLCDWTEIRGAGVRAVLRSAKFDERKSKDLGTETRSDQPKARRGTDVVQVCLGSLRWLRELGVDLTASDEFVKRWSSEGASIVGVATGTSLLGLFVLHDTLKPGAERVVNQLRRQGLRTYLVTGDNALTAASIADQAGIPR